MAGDDTIGFDGLDKLPAPSRYRAIVLDPNGRVLGMVRLKAENDPAALVQAQALVDGHAVELWDGMRYIEHFSPVD